MKYEREGKRERDETGRSVRKGTYKAHYALLPLLHTYEKEPPISFSIATKNQKNNSRRRRLSTRRRRIRRIIPLMRRCRWSTITPSPSSRRTVKAVTGRTPSVPSSAISYPRRSSPVRSRRPSSIPTRWPTTIRSRSSSSIIPRRSTTITPGRWSRWRHMRLPILCAWSTVRSISTRHRWRSSWRWEAV